MSKTVCVKLLKDVCVCVCAWEGSSWEVVLGEPDWYMWSLPCVTMSSTTVQWHGKAHGHLAGYVVGPG